MDSSSLDEAALKEALRQREIKLGKIHVLA